jgi:omega-3 fatty acid desaturase (delta-15 desaturase)
VGNVTHSSIMVPYHGWRISHRTHHANHGHVENDESWTPITKRLYNAMDTLGKMGRVIFPLPLFAYPFYLLKRSPGKEGSHYDPKSDLFAPSEAPLVSAAARAVVADAAAAAAAVAAKRGARRAAGGPRSSCAPCPKRSPPTLPPRLPPLPQIKTSNAFQIGWLGVLAACTFALGPLAMFNLYFVPYWVFVMWLDTVTYLHHHGPSDEDEEVPWYRGEVRPPPPRACSCSPALACLCSPAAAGGCSATKSRGAAQQQQPLCSASSSSALLLSSHVSSPAVLLLSTVCRSGTTCAAA